jgi:hypothetical protein
LKDNEYDEDGIVSKIEETHKFNQILQILQKKKEIEAKAWIGKDSRLSGSRSADDGVE